MRQVKIKKTKNRKLSTGKDEILFDNIVDTVPQWYKSQVGKYEYIIKINGKDYKFNSFKRHTPDLGGIYRSIKNKVNRWASNMPDNPTPSDLNQVREKIALEWLNNHDKKVEWTKVFAYLDRLQYRTHENESISLNIIISEGNGSDTITMRGIQDTIDLLGTSLHTYIKVDKEIRFLSYERSMWSSISDNTSYKFHPEFLHPIYSELKKGEYSVHLTRRGDIIILNEKGILASKRKNRWFIYDVRTLKNNISLSIKETVKGKNVGGSYRVACNLFETILDLSYKRSGALLVYDPGKKVITNIANKNSILTNKHAEGAHEMLMDSVRKIDISAKDRAKRGKRKLIEIASLDGAVVFDENRVTAFGAMIETSSNAGSHTGARTTAAHSAYEYGGYPIKVSSDGDINIVFGSPSKSGKAKKSLMKFM
jgi:hypothetical protein